MPCVVRMRVIMPHVVRPGFVLKSLVRRSSCRRRMAGCSTLVVMRILCFPDAGRLHCTLVYSYCAVFEG